MMDTIKKVGVALLSKPKTLTLIVSAMVWAGAKFGMELDDETALGIVSPLVVILVGLIAKDKVAAKKAVKEAAASVKKK